MIQERNIRFFEEEYGVGTLDKIYIESNGRESEYGILLLNLKRNDEPGWRAKQYEWFGLDECTTKISTAITLAENTLRAELKNLPK